MRIAYLTIQTPAPSEVFLAVEINGLRQEGADIRVFALRTAHPDHAKLMTDQALNDVSVRYFPILSASILGDWLYWLSRRPGAVMRTAVTLACSCIRQPAVLLRSMAILPKSFRIARLIEREQIPIVHTAWSHYPAVTAFLIKQLIPDVRLTMALGAYDRLSSHPMTAVAANRADYVLTQSQTLRDVIRREFPQIKTPIKTIARGVDLSLLAEHRGAERTPGLVATAGRLIEAKGHQFLIRAIAQIRREIPHAHLKIFGQGVYRPELEKLARELGVQDAVEFAEHLPQPQMFAQIARAQVFVLASQSPTENLPNSVKEAMALGIPVITTPTTGIEELVQDGHTGYVIAADDVDTLAERLRLLLNDPTLAKRVGDAAQEHVEAVAGLKQSSATRFQLYTELQRMKAGEK